MSVPTAEELVIRCKSAERGDTRAFEELVRLYKNRVYATAYRSLRDSQEAEDVAQEVFLKVYRNIRTLSDPSAITSWIYTITSNTCLDTLSRRKSRKGDVPLVFEGETEDERYIDNATMTPEQAAEQSELRRCLEAALGGLDSSSRMTIVLRDVEDRPYQELANNFKIGLSAIKMRIQRARQAFRQVLQEVCPDAWQKGI